MLRTEGGCHFTPRTILRERGATGQRLAGRVWRWMIDAQGTMRLMFDTMDAYDRADFDAPADRWWHRWWRPSMATRLGG
jgi:hypothetical protein